MMHGDALTSTDARDLTCQFAELKAAGRETVLFRETITGTIADFAEIAVATPGVAAKPEHHRIKERTARGHTRFAADETQRNIARKYNVSPATIFRPAL